jgi:hypothetical protein
MQERRRFPRVEAWAPVFARPLSRDPGLARGAALIGSLLDASRGGVAFACDGPVELGDLVQLDVRNQGGRSVLERYGRVVDCAADVAHGHVVRCSFVEPTSTLDWVGELEVAPAREPVEL